MWSAGSGRDVHGTFVENGSVGDRRRSVECGPQALAIRLGGAPRWQERERGRGIAQGWAKTTIRRTVDGGDRRVRVEPNLVLDARDRCRCRLQCRGEVSTAAGSANDRGQRYGRSAGKSHVGPKRKRHRREEAGSAKTSRTRRLPR